MSASALSPCPFCGKTSADRVSPEAENVPAVELHSYPSSSAHCVQCMNCGASGPLDPMPSRAVTKWNLSRPVPLSLQLRLERNDDIPAFGGFFRCECPDPAHDPVILLNVQALMAPELVYEEGDLCVLSREDRKRSIISTLMHEFGHALEAHFKLKVNEEAIEKACEAWEAKFAEVEAAESKPA